jgi:hypothetical protein
MDNAIILLKIYLPNMKYIRQGYRIYFLKHILKYGYVLVIPLIK